MVKKGTMRNWFDLYSATSADRIDRVKQHKVVRFIVQERTLRHRKWSKNSECVDGSAVFLVVHRIDAKKGPR